MKTSAIRARLAAKRNPVASLEQGDISIVVNQDGEQSTDGVDINASMPPELTEPDLAIADQPEVNDVLDADATDQADTLDEGDLEGDIQDNEQAINEGEDAIEALESYLGHIRELRASKMPVSAVTVEALHLGIEGAMGRWNMKAIELGLPSVESVTLSPQASLEAMEQEVVASMEGIADSINDFFRKQFNIVVDLAVGVRRNLTKEKARLDALRPTIAGLMGIKDVPEITDAKVIDGVEAVTLDAKDSRAVQGNLVNLASATSEVMNNRIDQVKAATDKAVRSVSVVDPEEGPDIEKAIVDFRNEVVDVLFADNRTINFWIAATPIRGTLLAGLVAGGAATLAAAGTMASAATAAAGASYSGALTVAANTSAGVGGAYIGAAIGFTINSVLDKAATRMPAPMRKKKSGDAVLTAIPALLPRDAEKVISALNKMIDDTLKANLDKNDRAKEIIAYIDKTFADAKAVDKETKGGAKESLNFARDVCRSMYGIESAILRGVRYSVPGVVNYVVASLKAAEAANSDSESTANAADDKE